ncbi:MAG TPA: hypothetical protein DE036_04230 [Actinobacteria bacterium]|nr:hypothetical protein [Actinomycetota bacterium]
MKNGEHRILTSHYILAQLGDFFSNQNKLMVMFEQFPHYDIKFFIMVCKLLIDLVEPFIMLFKFIDDSVFIHVSIVEFNHK